ncbi:aspartyl-phosphate phosphatase Spo0E family protein [Litchfieldia salsa]|uniref:Stage 0 sporulation regulatory protein n=1 Tax=Litchfieldia salsa TaxID=930152 RepID=A0A1H0X1D7_9BACI|nr:aspartyl-phosphate phosphatase Spo0E family protein [Litchfieldia salsa]SDP96659.1 stage 0 sporulation regulatory protein [Litchfieldia salsa]
MSKDEMLWIIERKRAELIEIALKNGLSSSLSIKYSQELDHLLNQYNKYPHIKLKVSQTFE